MLDRLKQAHKNLQSEVDSRKGEKRVLDEELDRVKTQLLAIEKKEKLLDQVVLLLQETADYARNQAKNQVEDLVSKCLQYIFESDIEFIIEFSESRNLPVAEFYVQSDYDGYSVKTKPEEARGGGVVDIISLALRISFLEIYRPTVNGPLFLDEPGKHVSEDYIFNLGEFIKESANMFDRQVIMVTHNPHLAQICDLIYQVDLKNGVSQVKKMEELA
ncbi:MAG: ATPase [Tissierellia bacterium]|nr:ATPase [Tissierellia bacterium]